MTGVEVITAIQFAQTLERLIEQEIASLRQRGENTPEVEAAYQARQAKTYAQPYAQPEPPPAVPPST